MGRDTTAQGIQKETDKNRITDKRHAITIAGEALTSPDTYPLLSRHHLQPDDRGDQRDNEK